MSSGCGAGLQINGAYLLGLAIWLFVCYIMARKLEFVAEKKGYGMEAHAFLMSFFLGVIGWIYVAMLPDLTNREILQRTLIAHGGERVSEYTEPEDEGDNNSPANLEK